MQPIPISRKARKEEKNMSGIVSTDVAWQEVGALEGIYRPKRSKKPKQLLVEGHKNTV